MWDRDVYTIDTYIYTYTYIYISIHYRYIYIYDIYDLGVAAASKSGKPPPESAPRIRATGALQCVQPTHKRGRKSILVTDGAPCYPKLTSEHSLLHEACNHSKGIFCITKKKEWGNLLVHTGGIDGMWKISKGAVSSSWSTRKDGVVNPQLLQGIRVWQWRWHHGNSTDFLVSQAKLWANAWRSDTPPKTKKKGSRPPQPQNPVNTTTFLQSHSILTGKI